MDGRECRRVRRIDGIWSLVSLAAMLGIGSVHGQTNEWTASLSDSWFSAGNWSEEVVPVSGPVQVDNINIPAVVDGAATGSIGNFFVGRTGFGAITVRNAGVLNSSAAWLGSGQSGTGRALITGADTLWNNDFALRVGASGEGELVIEDGAALINAGTARIGKFAGAIGSAKVRGDQSLWSIGGDLKVGRDGDGTLRITDQASVVNSGVARVGQSSGSSGSVVVTGEDSTWTGNSSLLIGDGGSGALTVSGGATARGETVRIGNLNGSSGELLIAGAGSRLEVNASFSVGHFGGSQGQAQVVGGGQLTGERAGNIGVMAGSEGVLEVSGSGSAWRLLGQDIGVGQSGSGELLITDAGVVSSRATQIGINAGSSGLVTVSGPDSLLEASSFIRIGGAGDGTLVLGGNATLAASNVIGIGFSSGSVGHLVIGDGRDAGTVDSPRIDGGSGDSTLRFDHADSAYHFTRDRTAAGAAIGLTNALNLVHGGPGTTVIPGQHSFNGETRIEAGTLQLDGSFVSAVSVQAGGRLSGSGTVDAPVEVADEASLSPGSGVAGTLTVASLSLAESSRLVFGLGAPGTVGEGVNDLVMVEGDLALNGQLEIVNRGGFDEGEYTLIRYSGALLVGSLNPIAVPGDAEVMVDTSVAGEIRLLVADFFEPDEQIFTDRFED